MNEHIEREAKKRVTLRDQTCSFCGKKGCYAKSLCSKCYNRARRNGTPEYIDRHGPRPERYSEKTKEILALHDAGMRNRDIAERVGLTRQAVSIVIKSYRKPTNYDLLVHKTPEEMAEFIDNFWSACWCPDDPPIDPDTLKCLKHDDNCRLCILDWLYKESTEKEENL